MPEVKRVPKSGYERKLVAAAARGRIPRVEDHQHWREKNHVKAQTNPSNVVKIRQRLSEREASNLKKMFSGLVFDFSDATDFSGHYFARAVRTASVYHFRDSFKLTNSSSSVVPSGSYHVLWKDIGSNPLQFVSMEVQSVHHCCPVLSSSDVLRKSAFQTNARSVDVESLSPIQKKIWNNLLSRNVLSICEFKSQYCKIRAPFVSFVHSTYDIALSDLVTILDVADCQVAMGVILFHPKILCQNSGILEDARAIFRKFKRDGRQYIRFSFMDDSQNGYEHDYQTYIALCSSFVLQSSRSGYTYVFSVDNVAFDHLFFRIVRTAAALAKSSVFRVYDLGVPMYKVIYTYDIADSTLERGLVPVRLVIPDTVYNRMRNYAMTLPEGKFTLKSIFLSACAFNQRMVVNGVNVSSPEPVSVDDLVKFCVAIYIITYDENFRSMAVLTRLKDDIQNERDKKLTLDNDFLRAAYNALFVAEERPADNTELSQECVAKVSSWCDLAYARALRLAELMLAKRKYPITVKDTVRFIEVESEVVATFRDLAEEDPPYTLSSVMPESVGIEPPELPEEPSVFRPAVKIVEGSSCVSGSSYSVMWTPGDGNCLFHAIRNSGGSVLEPRAMRKFLLRDRRNLSVAAVTALSLNPLSAHDRAAWGMDEHVEAFVRLTSIPVCIHRDRGQFRHVIPGTKPVGPSIHIHYSEGHWSAMRPKATTSFLIERFRRDDDFRDCPSFNSDHASFARFFSSTAERPAALSMRGYKRFKDVVDPVAELNSGGFVCRSALKLVELDLAGLLPTDVDTTIDLCAGPGGFSQFMLERTRSVVYAVSKNIPMSEVLYEYNDRFRELNSSDFENDLTNVKNFEDLLRQVRNQTSKVPLVLADGCVQESEIDKAKSNCMLKKAELDFASNVLSSDGTFVQKLFDPTSSYTIGHLLTLVNHFEDVSAIFLKTSLTTSTEFFAVANFPLPKPRTIKMDSNGFVNFVEGLVARYRERREFALSLMQRYVTNSTDERVVANIKRQVVDQDFLEQVKSRCSKSVMVGGGCLDRLWEWMSHTEVAAEEQFDSVLNFTDKSCLSPISSGVVTHRGRSFSSIQVAYYHQKAVHFGRTRLADMLTRLSVPRVDRSHLGSLYSITSATWEAVSGGLLDELLTSAFVKELESCVERGVEEFRYLSDDLILGVGLTIDANGLNEYGKALTRRLRTLNTLDFVDDAITDIKRPTEATTLVQKTRIRIDWRHASWVASGLGVLILSRRLGILKYRMVDIREPNLLARFVCKYWPTETVKTQVTWSWIAGTVSSTTAISMKRGVDIMRPERRFVKSDSLLMESKRSILSVVSSLTSSLPLVGSGLASALVSGFSVSFSLATLITGLVSEVGSEMFSNHTTVEVMSRPFLVNSPWFGWIVRRVLDLSPKWRIAVTIDQTSLGGFVCKFSSLLGLTMIGIGLTKLIQSCERISEMQMVTVPEGKLTMEPSSGFYERFCSWLYDKDPDEGDTESPELNLGANPHGAAVGEFREYCRRVHEAELSNHERVLNLWSNHPLGADVVAHEPGGYKVIQGVSREDQELYRVKYHNGRFIPISTVVTGDSVVSEYCKLALDGELAAALDLSVGILPGVEMVQAGPGCGKTSTIIEAAAKDDNSMILCSTREGKFDVRRRLSAKGVANAKDRVRTTYSVILNGLRNFKPQVLFIDEALMLHPGAVVAAIVKVGPSSVRIFGDFCQIPFVNRLGTTFDVQADLTKLFPITSSLAISYRCPADVVCRISPYYIHKFSQPLKSTSKVQGNTCSAFAFTDFKSIPSSGFDVYLTWTQADKAQLLAVGRTPVFTIHEFQGQQAAKVAVIRSSRIPTDELYTREAYAIVAISRHTEKLVYYVSVSSSHDKLLELIEKIPSAAEEDNHRIMCGGALVPDVATDLRVSVRFTNNSENAHVVDWSSCDLVLPQPYSLRSLKRCLVRYLADHEGDLTLDVSSLAEDYRVMSELSSVVYQLTRNSQREVRFYSRYRVPLKSSVAENVMIVNGLIDYPNEVDLDEFEPPDSQPFVNRGVLPEPDSGIFQRLIFDRFGDAALMNNALDVWMAHTEPLEIAARDCVLRTAVAPFKDRKYLLMEPALSGPSQLLRPVTQIESFLAAAKRNFCVPDMTGAIDVERESGRMLDAFLETYIDKGLALSFKEEVRVSSRAIQEWMDKQPPQLNVALDDTESILWRAVNEYSFNIKRQPKPVLDKNAMLVYPALQTILHHNKNINVIFCPIFQEIKKRLYRHLKSNCLLMTDCSVEVFCDRLKKRLDPIRAAELKTLEFDFSKFDKSQSALVLEFECKFLRKFGVPEIYVELWRNAHILSVARDPGTGIMLKTSYQRKTGDASTFFFNTIFVMSMFAHYFRHRRERPVFSLFAGDDSLLFFEELPEVDSRQFEFTYNMELKIFKYVVPHFCSKFLIPLNDHWAFVPDPVKLAVKLTRRDLRNREHVDLYRTSCRDIARNLDDSSAMEILSYAVLERYAIYLDAREFAASYLSLTATPDEFQDFFFARIPELIDNSPINSLSLLQFD